MVNNSNIGLSDCSTGRRLSSTVGRPSFSQLKPSPPRETTPVHPYHSDITTNSRIFNRKFADLRHPVLYNSDTDPSVSNVRIQIKEGVVKDPQLQVKGVTKNIDIAGQNVMSLSVKSFCPRGGGQNWELLQREKIHIWLAWFRIKISWNLCNYFYYYYLFIYIYIYFLGGRGKESIHFTEQIDGEGLKWIN